MLETIRNEGVDLWNTQEKFYNYEVYQDHDEIIKDLIEKAGEEI